MNLHLAFLDGTGRRGRLALAGEVTVGRGPESDLRLAARNVSRRHARFAAADGALWVEDLGSRNGTSVNGVPVKGRVRVWPGDEVRVADEALRVEQAGAEEPPDQASAASPPPLPGRRTPRPGPAGDDGAVTTAMAARPRAAAPGAAPRRRGWRGALAAAVRVLSRR